MTAWHLVVFTVISWQNPKNFRKDESFNFRTQGSFIRINRQKIFERDLLSSDIVTKSATGNHRFSEAVIVNTFTMTEVIIQLQQILVASHNIPLNMSVTLSRLQKTLKKQKVYRQYWLHCESRVERSDGNFHEGKFDTMGPNGSSLSFDLNSTKRLSEKILRFLYFVTKYCLLYS